MKSRQLIALTLCGLVANLAFAAEGLTGYNVKYSGGSLEAVRGGDDLRLFVNSEKIRLLKKNTEELGIPPSAITEISYGQEVHRRIGTAAGLAVVSLGIGALVAFSKSKKHYVGIVWDGGEGKKGGVVLQADKNEYRGLIAGLEGVSGKKAVDTDALTAEAAKSGLDQSVTARVTSAGPASAAQTVPAQAAPTVTPIATTPTAKVSPQPETSRLASPTPASTVPSHAEPFRVIPAATPVIPPKPTPTVSVTFASNPPGAVVSCNGTQCGRTPFMIQLLPGTYPVKFTLAGYPDWDAEITVDPSKPSTLVAQLGSTTGVLLK